MKKKEEEAYKEEGYEEDGRRKKNYIEKIIWNEDAIKKFKKRTEKLEPLWNGEGRSIEKNWQWIKKTAQEAMVRKRLR